jgi:hypothetical protein
MAIGPVARWERGLGARGTPATSTVDWPKRRRPGMNMTHDGRYHHSAPPSQNVYPAATTAVAAPSTYGAVAIERLAPGGTSYLPTQVLQQAPPMVHHMEQPAFAQAPMQAPMQMTMPTMPLTQTFPSNTPLYTAPAGYYVPPTTAGSHGHGHGHAREPIHAPGEPTGKLPYILPDKYATPLGYASSAATKPTLGECTVTGDVVTIRATGCPRWRLELKDKGWGAPIDAIADTKSATFRLNDAQNRTLQVRAAKRSPTDAGVPSGCRLISHLISPYLIPRA